MMRILVLCLLAFVVAAALAAPYPCTYTSPSTNNKVREWFVPRPAAWAWTCEYIHIAPSIVSISMTCRTCGATVARARKTTRLSSMLTDQPSTCTRRLLHVWLMPLRVFMLICIVSRDSALVLVQEHLWPDSRQLQLPSSKWCVPSHVNCSLRRWRCLQAHFRRLSYVSRSCVCARDPLSARIVPARG